MLCDLLYLSKEDVLWESTEQPLHTMTQSKTLRPEQNGRHFAGNNFIFLYNTIPVWLKFHRIH